jgi:hypothetical protein
VRVGRERCSLGVGGLELGGCPGEDVGVGREVELDEGVKARPAEVTLVGSLEQMINTSETPELAILAHPGFIGATTSVGEMGAVTVFADLAPGEIGVDDVDFSGRRLDGDEAEGE